ncbi:hypothetical protein T265_01182 [Opisthorchis viverrini]|uniref:Uncharacterized protein n=1 Tax=Opisthorchis viverrini TaxID=6198 RepID=A0A074ZZL1_OPIVI|nr:hypothetical protein T265_01182 [Opisthorchis viverrini]KER32903.1 hypothetical protein T265_01182 [Opisthorchis viverrini]
MAKFIIKGGEKNPATNQVLRGGCAKQNGRFLRDRYFDELAMKVSLIQELISNHSRFDASVVLKTIREVVTTGGIEK